MNTLHVSFYNCAEEGNVEVKQQIIPPVCDGISKEHLSVE